MKELKIFRDLRKKNIPNIIFSCYGILLACILFWVITTGFNNQFAGDDLIFLKFFNERPIFAIVYDYFSSFTGRLSNLTFVGFSVRYIPASLLEKTTVLISIGSLYASLVLLFYGILSAIKRRVMYSHIISATIVLALYTFGLATYDNFYWFAGITTYIVPVALFNFYISYALWLQRNNKTKNKIYLLLLFIVSLIGSMFNEAFTIQVLVVLIIASIALLIHSRKANTTLVLISLAYSIGLIIMRLAPGTANRIKLVKSFNPNIQDFSDIIHLTITNTLETLENITTSNYIAILLIILTGVLLGAQSSKILRKYILFTKRIHNLVVVVAFVFLGLVQYAVVTFIFAYSQGSGVTNYALFTADYFFYLLLALGATYFGIFFKPSVVTKKSQATYRLVGISLIISTGLIGTKFITRNILTIHTNNQLLVLQKSEAIETKKEIQQQVARGSKDIILEDSMNYFTYCTAAINPEVWCNITLAQYYNLHSIRAKEEILINREAIYE